MQNYFEIGLTAGMSKQAGVPAPVIDALIGAGLGGIGGGVVGATTGKADLTNSLKGAVAGALAGSALTTGGGAIARRILNPSPYRKINIDNAVNQINKAAT